MYCIYCICTVYTAYVLYILHMYCIYYISVYTAIYTLYAAVLTTLSVTTSYALRIIVKDPKLRSHSVDPQKNHRNYLIIQFLNFQYQVDPRHNAVLLIYIYISAVGSKTKKLAVLP